MTDKQKKKPLVFCKDCRHYDEDNEKPCSFKTGTKVTPIEVKDIYTHPEEDNKHNNCPHYEEWKTHSWVGLGVFVFLMSLTFSVIFESAMWLVFADMLLIVLGLEFLI